MEDNRLIAALLTIAVNSQRNRGLKQPTGKTDVDHTFRDYQQFLQLLKAEPQR